MSERAGVDVVRELLLASNRGDVDAVLACVDPAVEWHSVGLFLHPAQVWRGHAELRRGLEQRVEQYRGHPQVTLRDVGERDGLVLVVGAIAIPTSKRPMTLPVAWIFETADDGRVLRVRTYTTEPRARAAWEAQEQVG